MEIIDQALQLESKQGSYPQTGSLGQTTLPSLANPQGKVTRSGHFARICVKRHRSASRYCEECALALPASRHLASLHHLCSKSWLVEPSTFLTNTLPKLNSQLPTFSLALDLLIRGGPCLNLACKDASHTGHRTFSEHERYYGLGMDALVTVRRMLSEHYSYDGLGMGALVTVCSRNTNVIMVWAWTHWEPYALETRTLSKDERFMV